MHIVALETRLDAHVVHNLPFQLVQSAVRSQAAYTVIEQDNDALDMGFCYWAAVSVRILSQESTGSEPVSECGIRSRGIGAESTSAEHASLTRSPCGAARRHAFSSFNSSQVSPQSHWQFKCITHSTRSSLLGSTRTSINSLETAFDQ